MLKNLQVFQSWQISQPENLSDIGDLVLSEKQKINKYTKVCNSIQVGKQKDHLI